MLRLRAPRALATRAAAPHPTPFPPWAGADFDMSTAEAAGPSMWEDPKQLDRPTRVVVDLEQGTVRSGRAAGGLGGRRKQRAAGRASNGRGAACSGRQGSGAAQCVAGDRGAAHRNLRQR